MNKKITLFIMLVLLVVGSYVTVCYASEEIPVPQDFFTDGFICQKNSDGTNTYTITGYQSTIFTNIIPDEIDGKIITRIADGAFKNMPQFTGKINLPDTIMSIGNEAFYGCTNITSLSLGNRVASVGDSAFANCTSLETVDLNNVVTLGDNVFYRCTSLEPNLQMPATLTSIGDTAFYLSTIKKITFKTIKAPTITSKTFEDSTHIEIRVPENAQGYTAANYWPENVEEYLLEGDVNDDGLVDSADAAIVLNLFKYNNATEEQIARGDVDYNGILDSADAAIILNIYKYSI